MLTLVALFLGLDWLCQRFLVEVYKVVVAVVIIAVAAAAAAGYLCGAIKTKVAMRPHRLKTELKNKDLNNTAFRFV